MFKVTSSRITKTLSWIRTGNLTNGWQCARFTWRVCRVSTSWTCSFITKILNENKLSDSKKSTTWSEWDSCIIMIPISECIVNIDGSPTRWINLITCRGSYRNVCKYISISWRCSSSIQVERYSDPICSSGTWVNYPERHENP